MVCRRSRTMSSHSSHSKNPPRIATDDWDPLIPKGWVIDPVCRMIVDPTRTRHKAEHEGVTYSFCGPECREKFAAEPARFVAAKAEALAPKPAPSGTIY